MNKHLFTRRQFNSRFFAGVFAMSLTTGSKGAAPRLSEQDLDWYNVQDWGVEGKGWTDTQRYFDRLPGKAEGVVRDPVWNLSRDSAGMAVHFRTGAADILLLSSPRFPPGYFFVRVAPPASFRTGG